VPSTITQAISTHSATSPSNAPDRATSSPRRSHGNCHGGCITIQNSAAAVNVHAARLNGSRWRKPRSLVR
jgi:hypothetical protein